MYMESKNKTIQYESIKNNRANNIHPTAVIEEGAKIGKNVEIGAFCFVGSEVVIGDNCKLKPHVVIEGNTTLGKGNTIYSFATIGQQPQDLKYKGEKSRIEIGNNNSIREHCTIHPGTEGDNMITIVGNNNLLMVNVHIAHDCVIGDNCVFANNATLGGHVHVDDYVVIGGLAGIHQKVRIGKHAMIGGMTAIASDVIPYGIVIEDRTASLEGINLVGLKRRNFTREEIDNLRHFYKEAFCVEGESLFDIIEGLKSKYKGSKVVKDVIKFINADSKRHILTRTKK